jgi:hypothetical protein
VQAQGEFVSVGEIRLPDVYDDGDCGLVSVALDPDWLAGTALIHDAQVGLRT